MVRLDTVPGPYFSAARSHVPRADWFLYYNDVSMKRYFQGVINTIVLIAVVVWVVPFVFVLVSYEDTTIPDETRALDAEIRTELERVPANFADLYEKRAVNGPYLLSYLPEPKTVLSNQENYAVSSESIVYLTPEDDIGWQYLGTGSIVTDDGLILTNYHVIEGSAKVLVTTSAGVHYPVTSVVASDEQLDIAWLKIDAAGLRPLPIGDSDSVRVGDETLAIGHAEGFINTLSVGNVAGIRDYTSQGMGTNIQITNPISMGNSGGAVLNQYGEIVAIPTWSVEYDNNSVQVQNLNFAVPINAALELIQ